MQHLVLQSLPPAVSTFDLWPRQLVPQPHLCGGAAVSDASWEMLHGTVAAAAVAVLLLLLPLLLFSSMPSCSHAVFSCNVSVER